MPADARAAVAVYEELSCRRAPNSFYSQASHEGDMPDIVEFRIWEPSPRASDGL
jgi:hypothetical protein